MEGGAPVTPWHLPTPRNLEPIWVLPTQACLLHEGGGRVLSGARTPSSAKPARRVPVVSWTAAGRRRVPRAVIQSRGGPGVCCPGGRINFTGPAFFNSSGQTKFTGQKAKILIDPDGSCGRTGQ